MIILIRGTVLPDSTHFMIATCIIFKGDIFAYFHFLKKERKYTMGKNLHPLFYKDTLSILRELLSCWTWTFELFEGDVILTWASHSTRPEPRSTQCRKGWHIWEGSSKWPAENIEVSSKSLGFFPWLLVRRLTNKRQWMTARSRWLALFCLQTYVVGRTSKYTIKVLPAKEAVIVHVCSKDQRST